ncbi:MAG: AMIN domain-containing protein, partial [bacterium]|nr:AMIN domain-containing protein [bacterium]
MLIFILAILNAKDVNISIDETGVNITANKPFKVDSMKLENPPRIVVDLLRFKTKHKGLLELPGKGRVDRIRSAQFSINPDIYRVVIDLKQDATYDLFSNNNSVKVVIKPLQEHTTPQPKLAGGKSIGEVVATSPMKAESEEKKPVDIIKTLPTHKVTLDFENADIRDVLKVLSEISGVNIIYGADVTGTLSIRLENVPFNEAFNTILLMKNLVALQIGSNILHIMTPEKYTESKSRLAVFLETEIYNVKYQKPSEIKSQLEAIFAAEGENVKVNTNEANNQIIVTASPRI